jgi:hypothetical protein
LEPVGRVILAGLAALLQAMEVILFLAPLHLLAVVTAQELQILEI